MNIVSLSVDLMAPSIKNINKLLYVPTGCGEQNLITIVPRMIILEYLAKSNRLTSSMKDRLIRSVKRGKYMFLLCIPQGK